MVQSHAEHVHSPCILLHSKCYCNIWLVFCWHMFSLLFYVNKVLWDPGILFPPLLYTPLKRIQTYCKTFFLLSNLQAVNRWAALTGGRFDGLTCRFADPARLTKKSSGSGYVFGIAKSPFGIFSSKGKKPSPSEEREESKDVQESKGKDIFFRRWSTRRRLPSLLDRRSQKSRSSLIEPWFGGFPRLSLGISPALSFGKCFLKKY